LQKRGGRSIVPRAINRWSEMALKNNKYAVDVKAPLAGQFRTKEAI